MQIELRLGLGMRRIECPIDEVDPDGSGRTVGRQVEAKAAPLLVIGRQRDAVLRPDAVFRLKEQVRIDIERNPVKAGGTPKVSPRARYLERQIAVGQVAVHRYAGNC